MAQMIKNPPAMLETWVQSLGWLDSLEDSMAIQSIPVFFPDNPHGQKSLEGYSPQGFKQSDMTEQPSTHVLEQPLYKCEGGKDLVLKNMNNHKILHSILKIINE